MTTFIKKRGSRYQMIRRILAVMNFQLKEKKHNMELDFCGPESHLRKTTILNLESPSNLPKSSC